MIKWEDSKIKGVQYGVVGKLRLFVISQTISSRFQLVTNLHGFKCPSTICDTDFIAKETAEKMLEHWLDLLTCEE